LDCPLVGIPWQAEQVQKRVWLWRPLQRPSVGGDAEVPNSILTDNEPALSNAGSRNQRLIKRNLMVHVAEGCSYATG
jgi:hypothetical protein